jgi:predicted RNase H-like HicB family nuclease
VTQRYLVVFEKSPSNYSSFAPDVPGCVSAGPSLEEARHNMTEALRFHFEGMLEDGDPIPDAITTAYDFAGEDPEHGVEHCVVEWLPVELPILPPHITVSRPEKVAPREDR